MAKSLAFAIVQTLLFIFSLTKNKYVKHNPNKGLLLKGGEYIIYSKNDSNTTQVEIKKKTGNIENVSDINAALSKLKEKIISENKYSHSLKDQPENLKTKNIDLPVLKPEKIKTPDFNLKVFDKTRLKPDTSGNFKSDKNLDYIDKILTNKEYLNEYKKRIEENFLHKEVARKEFLRKRYDKLKIKKFVKNNLESQNRIKFIPLPLSNKEIFDYFILKNKFIIELTSRLLNLSILYFYLIIFKADIIKHYKLIYINYKNKQFKNNIEPIIKLLTIIVLFISILCFGSRLIKFIGLNLSYCAFLFYKFLLDLILN